MFYYILALLAKRDEKSNLRKIFEELKNVCVGKSSKKENLPLLSNPSETQINEGRSFFTTFALLFE